jgi:outer membrane protein OmpA-like peptidoglycan-associated protein
MKTEVYYDLHREFEKDLPRWDAELLDDATIRFKAPDVLFDSGRSELKQRFKDILAEFFPRYIAIIGSKKFRDSIQEIRIEGYTSSFWQSAPSEQDAYFQNMRLSQDRTRSTLEYVMKFPSLSNDLSWLREHVAANGLSYAKRIFNADGKENYSRSQRVEFRVRTMLNDASKNHRDGQVKLPDFTGAPSLNALRRAMGATAPGNFLPTYRPNGLTEEELNQLVNG